MRIEKAILRDVSPPSALWQSAKSPSSALFLCIGPALVLFTGASQGNIPLDMTLATVGCWCWHCNWHHRENSTKETACLEVSPWIFVTRQWDFLTLHKALSRGKYSISLPSSGLMGPIFSFSLSSLCFTFDPCFILKAPEVLGGGGNKWGWVTSASFYSLCINAASWSHGLSLDAAFGAEASERHIFY